MRKLQMQDLIDAEAELGKRGSLLDFARMAWPLVEPGRKFSSNWHLDAMSEYLSAMTAGELHRLVIMMPPACMKSLMVSVFWQPFTWIRDPSLAFIFASYDDTLTARDAGKSLEIMRSDWFRKRWGSKFSFPADVPIANFHNKQGGFRFSTSVQGKATGRHGDFLIAEDPLKPLNATPVGLETVARWWSETMSSRLRDASNARKLVVMQRLHENDLAGRCEAEGYEVLRLPMRYEPTQAWFRDPRKEAGELLWPERFPQAAVTQLEKDLGANAFISQYQQRPNPAGGSVFKKEWIQWIEDSELPKKFDRIVQSWDMTFKDLASSDFVVGQVWGMQDGKFYLLEMYRKRIDFPGTLNAVKWMQTRWPRTSVTLIEDKANGSAIMSMLQGKVRGMVPINPEGGKVSRANAVAPLFEDGNVFCALGKEEGGAAFERELTAFPKGSNDDIVDATSQFLTWAKKRSSSFKAAMDKLRGSGMIY